MNTHQRIKERVSKQQIGKHTTIEVLLETVFFIRSMQSGYKKSSVKNSQSSSGVPNEQLVESWEDGVESSGVEC
jgi:hypothetical protein